MPSDDSRHQFPPNVEWSIDEKGEITEWVIHGDYMRKGRALTHRDVDPTLRKPYLTREVSCSIAVGQPSYEDIQSYPSTNVAATQARQDRDTARQARLDALSANQAAYRKKQEVGPPTCFELMSRIPKLGTGLLKPIAGPSKTNIGPRNRQNRQKPGRR